MRNELLFKFIPRSRPCPIMAQCKLGIDPVFWPDNNGIVATGADVLPFARPE
jgi:hypothetical protein